MAIPAEEVFNKVLTPAERDIAAKRGAELIAEYFTLQQLRKARDLTRVPLAKLLGKGQVTISQMEKRLDMHLSMLRSYVEAMGGSLQLVVQFADRQPVVLPGLADQESVPATRVATKAKQQA